MPGAATTLLFARCIGFVMRAPGFSHRGVPNLVRVAFALVLALALTPLVHGPLQPRSFALALVSETIIGTVIGLAASAIYEGAASGGKLLDTYVGIQALNPNANVELGEGFSGLWGLLFIAAFFLLDGYRWLLAAFASTIQTLPPGSLLTLGTLQAYVVRVPQAVMTTALLVAGPALAIGFVAQIGIGAIARIVPRFSNFSLTFPVVFGLILLVTIASVPVILTVARGALEQPLPLPFSVK